MLPPEPAVIAAREAFADAQADLVGAPTVVGIADISWYGTEVDDERGCFGVVEPTGSLYQHVGDFIQLTVGRRSVTVYIIGSYSGLTTDMGITRRSYLAISPLAVEPVQAIVSVIT